MPSNYIKVKDTDKVINLYEQFKNTPKKLKIVCDWDEVIQACEPYALWKATKQQAWNKDTTFCIPFTDFFEDFWKDYLKDLEIIYSPYGSKLKVNNEEITKKQQEIKNSLGFYQEAPFLSIAEDLLRLIKEDKVEKLIFLSAYDKRKFPNGDDRKQGIFAKTFFRFNEPTTFDAFVNFKLIGFINETIGQSKADWIKENASDFDIVIDDNPNICRSLVENNGTIELCEDCEKYRKWDNVNCKYCKRMNIKVLAPYYPAVKKQHDEKVLLVKNEVSELKREDFTNSG